MSLHFLHSGYLWLILPTAGILWFVGRNREAGTSRHQSAVLWILLGCVLAVIAALAEPYIGAVQNKTCVFLADVSGSISDAELTNVSHRIHEIMTSLEGKVDMHIVCFASYPLCLSNAGSEESTWNLAQMRKSKLDAFKSVPGEYYQQTDIQSALLYAQMLIKEDGDVYVFTDGLETRGRAENAIPTKLPQHVQFYYETLNSQQSNEIILSRVLAPELVRQGQNASVQVIVDSSGERTVEIIAHNLNNDTKQRYPFTMHAGINEVTVPIDTSKTPVVSYQLMIEGGADTCIDNNRQLVTIPIIRKPVVAVLDEKGNGRAYNAIQNWLSDTADVQTWSDQVDLNKIDALFMADADTEVLNTGFIDRIRQAVDGGMGLVIFPGQLLVTDRLLAEGPFAELLPVSLYQDGKKTNPDTTVVFIVDTSGSMTGSRLSVAREIARRAISRLAPYDKAGIVEFYGNRRWAAPIQSAANQLDLYRALNRLTGGGGTVIIPAMEEAYYALLNVNSTTRHIVVISDGGVEKADYEALLRKISDSRISVSTILVGPATHTGFMAELSQWGQGGFFHAEERFILPDMNFKSVLDKTGSPYRHTTDPLVARYPSTLLSGVSMPRLTGSWDYLPAQVKRGGQAVVEFSSGQPMVTLWNYSLGEVVFWSVDLFHQQISDTDIPQMAANLSRKIYRTQNQDVLVRIEQNNNEVDFKVQRESQNQQESANLQNIVIYSDPMNKTSLPLSFMDGRAGSVVVNDLAQGNYKADIEDNTGHVVLQSGFSVNAIPEIKACQSDRQLMDRLNRISGAVPDTQSTQTRSGTLELWPYCIMSSMALLLLHILVRRFPFAVHKSPAIWALLLLIPSCTVFAAAETANTDSSPSAQPVQDIYVRTDPNTHRPVFSDMVSMLGSQPVDLKTTAVLCSDYTAAETIGASSQISSFPDGMLAGFYFYKLSKYGQAYDAFQGAAQLAKTDNDRKYALAWSLRMAEKSDKREVFEAQLLDSKPFLKYHCRVLELLYGLNNDPNKLRQLYDKIESLPGFNDADKARLQQQIIDMSLDNTNGQQLTALGTDVTKGKTNVSFMLGQVRSNLVRGQRSQAAQLLESMIADPNLSQDWLVIAQNAARMAFYDIADQAAANVMKLSDSQRYAAGIFRVTLMLSIGRQSKAIEMLNELQKTVKLDERQDYEIAQYYEKLGQYSRAIEQYNQIYLRTQAVDVQMRIAWLHEKNGNYDQAYQAWLTLWKDCRQQALLYQIQPRLLEVASRTGQLASLAIQLEETLEKSKQDTKTLELLVDIYVSVGDSIAAVELVRQYCGQTDINSLEWQYRIYIRCREYGRCRRVLYQLIEKDPQHTGDYYRQLALLAVEKGDEKDALSVVKAIRSSRDANTIDLEYTAGIWDLLERPELAMEAYDKLLRQGTPAAETWLLWSNAAVKAGRKDAAIATLSELLKDDISDDLFTVAVDGLLNLKADQNYLENALVHIYARIAKAREKVFFYRLAVDVLSEMGGGSDYAEFLFPAAIYAPDGRVALLQEIQRGAAVAQTNDSLDYGIVLVYMDTQLPPHAGIELGKSFLERGEYRTAHFLFHRTPYLFEDSSLCLGIADAYDRIGAFQEAALLVGEALSVTPDNPQLLIRSASYAEIKGDFAMAWDGFLKAYQLTLNSLSTSRETLEADSKTTVKNAQTEDRNFRIALYGLLATMNTKARVEDTFNYFETTLDTLNQQDIKTDRIAYTRLMQVWKDYEQICLARGDVERANKHVSSVIGKYIDSPEFLAAIIQTRLAGGDSQTALEIAEKIDKKYWPQEIKWLIPDSLDPSKPAVLTNEILHYAMMKSILSNDTKQAERWMEEILSRKSESSSEELRAVEFTSAVLLEKPEYLKRLISKQLDGMNGIGVAKRYTALESLITSVWPLLSEVDRKWVISQIAASELQSADIQHLLDITMIRSHYKTWYPPERALDYAEGKIKQADRLAEILSYSEPNQRNVIVERAIASLSATRRGTFMLELAGQIQYQMTDQEQSGYTAIFKTCIPVKLPPQNQYVLLSRYTGKNSSSRLLLLNFAEILLSNMPDSPAINGFAIKSRFNAGKLKEAKSLARNMIDTLSSARETNYEFKAMLDDAVRTLSYDDVREILSECMSSLEITGPSPQMYFVTAVLSETLGDHQLARTQMGKCYDRMQDNMMVMRQLIDWYEAAGLRKELMQILSLHAQNAGTGSIFLWRTLVRLYYQTSQIEQMKDAASKDATILHNMNYLALYQDANDITNVVTYFRKFQADFRNEGRFLSFTWPDWDSSEGLVGWHEKQDRIYNRKDMHLVLSTQAALREDYHRIWDAMTPDRNDFSKVADAYAHILYLDGQAENTIKTILNRKTQGLSLKDYTLLLHMVKYETQAGVFKSQDALDCLQNHPEIADIDILKIIASACRVLDKQSISRQYYRWIWVYQMMSRPRSETTFDLCSDWIKNKDTKDINILETIAPWINAELFNEDRPDYESQKTRFIAVWYDNKVYQTRIKEIEGMVVNHEYEVTYSPLQCDMLRYSLQSGQAETFTKNLSNLLRTQAMIVTGDTTVDFHSIISKDIPAERIDKYIELIKNQMNQMYQKNVISDDDIVRNLAILAVALKDNNYPSQADMVLGQIYPLKKNPGMVSLWVSDALRQCGRTEQADQIDHELIENGSMPKIRIKKMHGK